MPESGLQAAERPAAERPTAGSQVLSDTGDLSEYRSNWTAGGELPDGYAKLTLFTQPVPNGLEVAMVESAKASRKSELEEIWRKRKGGRASPVLVVAVPAGAVAMPPANAVPPADTRHRHSSSKHRQPTIALSRQPAIHPLLAGYRECLAKQQPPQSSRQNSVGPPLQHPPCYWWEHGLQHRNQGQQ